LQSHYLNQLVGSDRRATVLSFRGLAINISYGLMSLVFSAAVAAAEAAGMTAAEPLVESNQPAFRFVVGVLPVYFLIAAGLFVGGVGWWVRDRGRFGRRGGFPAADASNA
jgi:hypothetical protein